ncbi:MAG: SDR family oxidoreductase [Tistlia sp.]|uniref:SDR family oxidoreductase n=1 Tax=Tistlia sp. TaxID=3057121 RepID=UPI0034A494F4
MSATASGRPVLLVTGASRGIGAATARLAGERGYDVCVNYNSSRQAAEAVADDVRSAGGRAVAVQADVACEDALLRLFETVDRELGPLRALVNNAGTTGQAGRLESLAAETLQRVLALNVTATVLASREAVRRMSRSHGGAGGAIVNVSSRAATLGGAGEWLHYAASKGAVESFTLGLAREVAAEGVRVNAVSPGLIETEIHAAAGGGDRLSRLVVDVPQARVGTAEEVARAILWLLGGESSYVAGASLPVAGGR